MFRFVFLTFCAVILPTCVVIIGNLYGDPPPPVNLPFLVFSATVFSFMIGSLLLLPRLAEWKKLYQELKSAYYDLQNEYDRYVSRSLGMTPDHVIMKMSKVWTPEELERFKHLWNEMVSGERVSLVVGAQASRNYANSQRNLGDQDDSQTTVDQTSDLADLAATTIQAGGSDDDDDILDKLNDPPPVSPYLGFTETTPSPAPNPEACRTYEVPLPSPSPSCDTTPSPSYSPPPSYDPPSPSPSPSPDLPSGFDL